VTFSSAENAQKAVSTQHSLNGRMLEVKVATPREEMKPPAKKITRVFVARIPPIVTDEMFRRYSFLLCLGLISLSCHGDASCKYLEP
jgi:RNA-binding protein Musashi